MSATFRSSGAERSVTALGYKHSAPPELPFQTASEFYFIAQRPVPARYFPLTQNFIASIICHKLLAEDICMIEHGRFFILHVKLLVGEPLERLRNGRNRELWGWLELWPFAKRLIYSRPGRNTR